EVVEVLRAERPFHEGRADLHALQPLLRLCPALRRPADRNYFVQRRNRDELTFEYVAPLFGLAQQEFGPPTYDLHAVANELFEHLLDVERLRPALNERDQNDADCLLQR